MRAIFGLGNIGKEYEMTRHNAGFMVIGELCRMFNVKLKNKNSLQCMLNKTDIEGQPVYLCEPTTFMNSSGWAVGAVCDYYKIEPKDILIIYDDIDIPFGELRIRQKGSPGTHNGMKSIVQCLGTDAFPRLRIGIGKPEFDMISFVLGKFDMEQREELPEIIKRAAEAAVCVITEGFQKAQELYQKPANESDNGIEK